jgi:hypothetical protein
MDGEGVHWQQMEAVGSSSWKCNSELNLREGGLSSDSRPAVSVQFQLSQGSFLQFCPEETSLSGLYEILRRISVTLNLLNIQ